MTKVPILIVDDNPLNTLLVHHILVARGFEVRSAADAPEAFEILKTFLPSLIVMDVRLPGMDGLELTRRLKADPRTSDIQIMAVTASAMADDERLAMNAGCDGYIAKPINTRTLADQLLDCLERADARRALAVMT
ncbi:MAG: response regulator [Pseudomonadota bacterium]|nr:response regulator [Pseudomonadota bacterium]